MEHDCVLEIISCVDASKPLHRQPLQHQGATQGGKTSPAATNVVERRLLRMQLTDGVSQCGAIEYMPLGNKSSWLPGETLTILAATRCVGGMLLLQPELVHVSSSVGHGSHSTSVSKRIAVASREEQDSGRSGDAQAPKFRPLDLEPMAIAVAPQRDDSDGSSAKSGDGIARHGNSSEPSSTGDTPVTQRMPAPAPPKKAASVSKAVAAAVPKPPPATPAAKSGLDPDMVADLMAMGLTLREIHEQLGLPPPGDEAGADAAGASAPSSKGPPQRGAGANGRGTGGRGRSRR